MSPEPRGAWRWAWPVLLLLAAGMYLWGLGGAHIPTNGDESVYAHITRLTADSGRWLPLQSQLDHMRNTKPPLIFWQGLLSTDMAQAWDLWHLRWPSVVYTLATAALLLSLGWRLAGSLQTGCVAALVFLAFFSTYRYGRPYLTNPPEVFWFFVPVTLLLHTPSRWFAARGSAAWGFVGVVGVCIGLGLLYKSFALLLPVGGALAWMHLHRRGYKLLGFIQGDAPKLVLMGVVALAMFGLWFALDPDPAAVWREFVVGENLGKMDAQRRSYLSQAMWGDQSVLLYLVGYLFNPGLLAFPFIALCWRAWRERRSLSPAEQLLWIWVASFVLVFALPSQRSDRYLLDTMPAVALLMALRWRELPRLAFTTSLLFAAAVIVVLSALAFQLQRESAGAAAELMAFWAVAAALALCVLAGLVRARWTPTAALCGSLLALASLAAFVQPLEGPIGRYTAATMARLRGQTVFVPCNFRANDESRRFVLPGADVRGYNDQARPGATELAQRYPLFAVRGELKDPPCEGCRLIDSRYTLRSRHTSAQFEDMARGHIFENLFVRESLVEAPAAAGRTPPPSECR